MQLLDCGEASAHLEIRDPICLKSSRVRGRGSGGGRDGDVAGGGSAGGGNVVGGGIAASGQITVQCYGELKGLLTTDDAVEEAEDLLDTIIGGIQTAIHTRVLFVQGCFQGSYLLLHLRSKLRKDNGLWDHVGSDMRIDFSVV